MNKEKQLGFWFGLFLGGLISAITMAVISTKEGKKLAKDFWKKIEPLIDELGEKLEEAEEEIKEKGEGVIEKFEGAKETFTKKLEETKEQVIDEVHKKVHQAASLPEPPKETLAKSSSSTSGQRFFKKDGEPLG